MALLNVALFCRRGSEPMLHGEVGGAVRCGTLRRRGKDEAVVQSLGGLFLRWGLMCSIGEEWGGEE
ncbi:MAG: hypothetical protein IJV22_01310 [Bacteroidales bacterium]|nr:hypothetical protein [Bacteroidales bacterium]